MYKQQHTRAYVIAHNAMIAYLQRVAPIVHLRLLQGFNLKADGSLFKKDADSIKHILNSVEQPNGLRCYININEYSGCLECDINYKVGSYDNNDYYCEYIKETVFIWSQNENVPINFDGLKTITEKQVNSALVEIEQVEKKIRELESRKYSLKQLLNQ